jgi:hypothetical protein
LIPTTERRSLVLAADDEQAIQDLLNAYMARITQLRLAGMLAKPFSFAPPRDLLRHAAGDGLALEKDGTYERQL